MKKKQTMKQWLWEFTKRIVVMVAAMYAVTSVHDRIFLWFYPESSALPQLSEQMARIFEITVVCYAIKAGFENVTKIKKYNREEISDE